MRPPSPMPVSYRPCRGRSFPWLLVVATALLATACRGAPSSAGTARAGVPRAFQSPDPFHGELFDVVEEPDGVRAGRWDPDALQSALVKRARVVRVKPGLLPVKDDGARHLWLNVQPGVSIPVWVQAPRTIDLGFRRWRAEVEDDPEAWVGIIGSPEPIALVVAAPAPAPIPAPLEDGQPAEAEAPVPAPDPTPPEDEQPAKAEELPKEPGKPIAHDLPVPGGAPPAPATPLRTHGINIRIRSPRYGDYEIIARGDAATYVVKTMDYSVLPPCGVGRDPTGPKGEAAGVPHARARCGCRPCRCCDDGRKRRAGGPRGQADVETEEFELPPEPGMGFVGTPSTLPVKTIDVMVLYTAECRDESLLYSNIDEAALQRQLLDDVEFVNDAMALADTRAELRCVSVGLVIDTWGGTGSTYDMYTALRNPNSPRFANVHAWRDQPQVRADLVSVVAAPSSVANDACGYGDLLLTTSYSSGNAFSVVRSSCLGGLTLPHELGHAFGCCHAWADTDETCRLPREPGYRYAWPFEGWVAAPDGTWTYKSWTTLMGYAQGGSVRLKGWSSPDVRCEGSVMGNTQAADNARMIRETAAIVAGYR